MIFVQNSSPANHYWCAKRINIIRLSKIYTGDKVRIFSESSNTAEYIKELSGNSPNLNITENKINGIDFRVIAFENMTDSQLLTQGIINFMQFCEKQVPIGGKELYNLMYRGSFITSEKKELETMEDLYTSICSGFAVIVINGVEKAIALGVQGYNVRSIGEPTENAQIMGSKESFTESVKTNQTMVRRRLKTEKLRIEEFPIGKDSKTNCSIAYLTDRADMKVVDKIREKLKNDTADIVLESGAVRIAIDERPSFLFSQAVPEERPDALCQKLAEGRIGIMIDGTPFAVIVPYLFRDHFQSLDDYSYKVTFANIIRFLRYLAYVVATIGSGLFVAAVKFHPQWLPQVWLQSIQEGIKGTPFGITGEMLIILVMYEIMREAGLRLPREVGHTISIVGSLIIGDAAVSGGLLSPSVVLIAALTSVTTYIVPTLIDSTVPLKFAFVIAGGLFGGYGIGTLFAIYCILVATKKSYGVRFAQGLFIDIKRVRTSYAKDDSK